MAQAQSGAWWEDVEHLREAAERRSQERARAKREGREPVALTPLRALRDDERNAPLATVERERSAPRPTEQHATGRFRRHSPTPALVGGRPVAAGAAAAAVLAPEPEIELDFDTATVADELGRLAEPAERLEAQPDAAPA